MPGQKRGFWALAVGGFLLGGCPRGAAPPATEGPLLKDVAAQAGLNYRWQMPGKTPRTLRDTIGHGAAFLDYDADGKLDVLLVGSPCALFRGDGRGRFTDVSEATGLRALAGAFSGVAVGDYDADGLPDLYLSAYRGGALLKNEGGRRFVDVSKTAGVPSQPWGSAAAFVDENGDGRLDLVVGNYVRFEPEKGTRSLCEVQDATGRPTQAACGPIEYDPLLPALYRNQGNGRFAPAAMSGLRGRTLGIAAAPDEEGRVQIAFANDEMPGDLLVQGRNVADERGVAYDRDGRLHGGMGLDWGDTDGDGRLDLVVATFRMQPNSLYRARPEGDFLDEAFETGIGAPTRPYVAFGCQLVDLDNDGDLDLTFVNGHVQDNAEKIITETALRQPGQLFLNGGKGVFTEAMAQAGDLKKPIVGRALASGDFDDDGRIDLLAADSDGTPLLLRNQSRGGSWLGLRLLSGGRDAYGARVTAKIGDRTLVRHCHADGSYFSSSDPRVHLGLGGATKVDTLDVRWPSGKLTQLKDIPAGKYLTLREE